MNEEQKNSADNAKDNFAKIAPMFGTVGGDAVRAPDQKPKSLEFAPEIPSPEDVANLTAPDAFKKNADALAEEGIILERSGGEMAARDPLFASRVLEQEREALRIHARPGEKDPLPSFEIVRTNEEDHLPKIRTYRSDVAGALKKEKTSVIQMVLAEQGKKHEAEDATSPRQPKNMAVIVLSIALVLLGIGLTGLGAWRYVATQREAVRAGITIPSVPSPILVEAHRAVDITGLTPDRIARAVAASIASAHIRLDAIEQLYPIKEVSENADAPHASAVNTLVSTVDFWTALDSGMPDSLVRALSPQFMIGVHVFNGNQPFIILRADYFESAFAGMLRWEKTLARDVLPLFGITPTPNMLVKPLEDIVIRNQDYRALRNDNGDIVLLYLFHDKSAVIIATADETIKEVVDRLNRPQQ